ncbi:NAD(P)H-dependent oxidoreductase [Paenibacillus sp. OV219]|uniref:NAD(P)H-dependent oxidoreductase n=1 Tax=Paenibacillus sp. OV219 TaxID=1884377 RepID=UPI0008D0400F|nr:NAD(P)H-dependent oxidoreductase [Paenibacillus sp. OV219]SEO00888.1 Putative NADPH-quinone reductase (modulator of drug activity B) [Paenibacillus sp. OV219]
MNTLVIVTHPNLEASRVNSAWLEELRKHNDITVHELYEAYPDENIDVAKEQALIEAHDRIIFQYPLYWYSSPMLLKKWFDSVLQYGWAYGPNGSKTAGKEFGAAISTYGSEASYQPSGSSRSTLAELLRPVEATTRFISGEYLPHFAVSDVSNLTDERLAQSTADYIKHIRAAQPVTVA